MTEPTRDDGVPSPPELTPQTYLNRELATIEFQKRVLAQANDPTVPLLERVKFLAIVGSNLDEFFMVRVASYIQKLQAGITRTRPDGYTPSQILQKIRTEVDELYKEQRRIKGEVFKLLEAENIRILKMKEVSKKQREALKQYFNEVVFPVLTPFGVDHARPFPFISNLSLNLGVFLERSESDNAHSSENGELLFARIKVPVGDVFPRLVSLNETMERYANKTIEGHHFVWIEDVIIDNLEELFPGMNIVEAYPFRVLRNADIDYESEQEEGLDVMSFIEAGVRERRFGFVVKLSVPKNISDTMLERLKEGLELHPQAYTYKLDTFLGSANLFELAGVDRPDLKYESYVPKTPAPFSTNINIFDVIRRKDYIVHHPYDTFLPVEEFFSAAATDPKVVAIKATLYRVGKNSSIVKALMDARDNNKQVTVLVELKARFDEENNLTWAKAMEEKGIHVIYGVEELHVKTHAKIALVVRRENDGVHRYLHLGTGNYNASTARLYTDLGLFTANDTLGDDASRLFNRLTGYAPATEYQKLLVAPEYLFDTLIELIDNEIQAARAGKEARLILKMNQLEEDEIIRKLYEASQAGVQVDLLVRGFCCLIPGVPRISENIRVVSIIGRFLEHSRAYYFRNAPDEKQLLLGSADLMRRNLHNRVEVVFPVLDARARMRVLRMLATQLLDNQGAWELQPDGKFIRLQAGEGETKINSQHILMQDSFGLDLLP